MIKDNIIRVTAPRGKKKKSEPKAKEPAKLRWADHLAMANSQRRSTMRREIEFARKINQYDPELDPIREKLQHVRDLVSKLTGESYEQDHCYNP